MEQESWSETEVQLAQQVDAVFEDPTKPTRQRIEIAAFALHDPMMNLRVETNKQNEQFEAFTRQSPAPDAPIIWNFGFVWPISDVQVSRAHDQYDGEIDTSVGKARDAVKEALVLAQNRYSLSRWQAKLALRMSNNKF